MPEFQTVMDIFKILDKSNCRKCNEKTCLAFAAAVHQGRRNLSECPKVPAEILSSFRKPTPSTVIEAVNNAPIESLKKRIGEIDLAEAAMRIGAKWDSGRLILRVFGKEVAVDSTGAFTTDIHINPWVVIPVLTYILEGKGVMPSGRWVPFRELDGGMAWLGLYEQQGEKLLKKVADTYPDLFRDMIELFNGKRVENMYEADISLVLNPLPLIPILVCYWLPEEGMSSSLTLFFDKSVDQNLDIQSIYGLVAGIAHMFEKIAARHGFA
ncbi:MAG: DUF3786 domain-containing protein [Thermodesulfobacteriota bacterium]